MQDAHSDTEKPSSFPVVVAFALLPIPIGGWLLAQTFIDRIGRFSEYTGALFHTLAASTFAVIFLISAVTNAIIVAVRNRDRPHSFRARRYPAFQLTVIALGIAWLVCLRIGGPLSLIEMITGICIAAMSVVTFAFAILRDPASSLTRRQRIDRRIEAASPAARRRVKVAKIALPVLAVTGLAALVVTLQSTVVEHRGCTIVGTGVVNESVSFYTAECGDFAVDSTKISHRQLNEVFYGSGTVDITTRGYAFGLPPLPVAISIIARN
jgi:hypothetical protein